MEILQISLTQIISMFTFVIIGYILRSFNKVNNTASKVLSTLLVNVSMPAMIFKTCATNMTVEKFLPQSKVVLTGVIVIVSTYLIAKVLSRLFSKDAFERSVYTYSFTIPNIGYMGMPLIEAVFGSEMLFYGTMFVFPFYIFIYSKGIEMLSQSSEKSIKDVIFKPTILAIVLGVLIGLSGITLPDVVNKITSSASSCSGPLAMIITGIVIAEHPFKEMVKDYKVYIASVIRLIAIPLLSMYVMTALNLDKMLIAASTAMLAMPLGLNTVVFPEAYGGDGSKGASLALVSHTISILTLPVIFAIIS